MSCDLKISIITPLYNKAPYIQETMDSVVAQTFSDWEMLIVDNNSTDDGAEKVRAFHDSRISLLQCPKQGPGAARNFGLERARGEWIQFLDADDLLEPDHLEQQLKSAQENSDAGIVACRWRKFSHSEPQKTVLKNPTGLGQTNNVLRDAAIAYAPWAVHAALVKRSLISKDMYWPEALDDFPTEDTAFWFPLVMACKVVYGDSCGALYRIVQLDQRRNQDTDPVKWFLGNKKAIQHNLEYAQKHTLEITAGHCESLMRVYSNIYLMARYQRADVIQEKALKEAEYWFNKYFERASKYKFSMLCRRWIGLKRFLDLIKR